MSVRWLGLSNPHQQAFNDVQWIRMTFGVWEICSVSIAGGEQEYINHTTFAKLKHWLLDGLFKIKFL